MNTKWKLFVGLLILGNVFFGWRYAALKNQKNQAELLSTQTAAQSINRGVLEFTGLFIDKVLQADGEVDFETRLLLENKVRELNNKEILASWQKFAASPSEAEAQTNVKDLLALLVKNLKTE